MAGAWVAARWFEGWHWINGQWQTLSAPQATLLGAVLVGAGVLLTVSQKRHSERRDQWWARVQWVADYLLTGSDLSREVALGLLPTLGERRAASRADRRFLLRLARAFLSGEPDAPTGSDEGDRDEQDELGQQGDHGDVGSKSSGQPRSGGDGPGMDRSQATLVATAAFVMGAATALAWASSAALRRGGDSRADG